jgi:heat shock protein HslJ
MEGRKMNKIYYPLFTLLVAAGLIFSACVSQGSPAGLPGSSWKLVSYGPAGKPTLAAAGIQTSLDFGRDGKVSGSMGCNSFSGDYQVKIGKVVFGQMAATMKACPDPQMTQESAVFQVLAGSVRFQVEGKILTIYAASGADAVTFSRQ